MTSAVVFGAGSIGRGFVGALIGSAGWEVTFVDVASGLVDRLNADGGYNQIIIDDDGDTTMRVDRVNAVLISDSAAVVRALVAADLVATAVGAANLPSVAGLLAVGITAREQEGIPAPDVLLCENLHHAPTVFRDLLTEQIGPEAADRVGLAATSIGRMVPLPIPNEADPSAVRVEPYSFLPYDASAFNNPLPDIPGLVPVRDGFALYEDRKLFVHNMGHFALALLGELRGHEFVWQAVGDVELRSIARGAMVETAMSLSQIHGVAPGGLLRHIDDLLARFGNRRLADTTERVGRDPVRKMSPEDRLVGSYTLCRQAGVTPSYVSVALALGAVRLSREPGWDSRLVLEYLDRHAFKSHDDPSLRQLFCQLRDALTSDTDVTGLTRIIDQSYFPSRIV